MNSNLWKPFLFPRSLTGLYLETLLLRKLKRSSETTSFLGPVGAFWAPLWSFCFLFPSLLQPICIDFQYCRNFVLSFTTSLAFYRSPKGLSLENSEKSLKGASRSPSAPGSKKLEKESKTTIFQVVFWFSARFRLFLRGFLPRAERPRKPLFRLFSEFSRERPFGPL